LGIEHAALFDGAGGPRFPPKDASTHRRPVLSAGDVAALTLTGIGSGINLYGYYIFHVERIPGAS
jgi:hypothetical protein